MVEENKICDKCGQPMVLRLAKRGRNAGNYFWGCTEYPSCKNTAETNQSEVTAKEKAKAGGRGSNNSRAFSNAPASEVIQALGMQPLRRDVSRYQHPRALKIKGHHQYSVIETFDSRGELYNQITNQQVRNWALEYKRSSGTILTDAQRTIISVFEKHLRRGREILLDHDVEDFLLTNHSQLAQIFSDLDFDTFNSDAPIFDSDEEREFWKNLEDKVPRLTTKMCPQVYVESLVPKYEDTNQRVDFFCKTELGFQVIEIDGAQHQDPKQLAVDQARDQLLTEQAGIEVTRFTVDQAAARANEINIVKDSAHTSPEQVAHVISVTISQAIKSGTLRLDSAEWVVRIYPPVKNNLLSDFFIAATKGSIKHFRNLTNLFTTGDQFPQSVRLIVDEESFDLFRSPLEETNNSSQISIHFDKIPKEDIAEGHFYYRECPTNYLLKIDVIDTAPLIFNPNMEACKYFLKYFFRFDDFREGQWEGIKRTLSGKDSLVLLPTGHGKSVVYQLASLLKPGTALVIDPIISLMDDQIDNLSDIGITRAIGISSQIKGEDTKRKIIEEFGSGQFFFAFVAPERLQMVDFRNALRTLTTFSPISVVAIDEAHCVSEWGHDFRTSYLNLGRNCREFCSSKNVSPPLLGLTGTASRSVLKDIKRELEILDFEAIITPKSFNRDELKFRLEACESNEKTLKLKGILTALPSIFGGSFNDFYQAKGKDTNSGLVFCRHVNGSYGVVEVARLIREELGIPVSFYSGSVPKGADRDGWNEIKRGAAYNFKKNNTPLMVATNAFGMGIDKPNVRYSIHFGIPPSIESFYQEAGRAGRDRKDAMCYVIASNDDSARTAKVLSDTSSIEAVDEIVKKTSYKNSDDILRSLFFHTSSFRGIDEELGKINKVLEQIEATDSETEISIDASSGLSTLEKAIHRLVIIGYIKDYTIDYSGKRIDVKLAQASTDNIRDALLKYVENYQRSRSKALAKDLPGDKEFSRQFLRQIIQTLLEFIYETVELGRRRALLEMAQVCNKGNTDENIRTRILAYLERSEFDDQLEEIVENIEAQSLVSQILEEVVSPNHAQSLRGQVARYLESYPDHPNLLLLRATVECMCSEGNPDIVISSLEEWAKSATTKYSLTLGAMADSYNYAMDFITKGMPLAAARATKTILSKCEDKKFIRHVLENARNELESMYALTALMNMSVGKLEVASSMLREKAQ